MVVDKWKEKIVEVVRVTDRIIYLKLMVDAELVTFVSIYAPQSGLGSKVRKSFIQIYSVCFRSLIQMRKYICMWRLEWSCWKQS